MNTLFAAVRAIHYASALLLFGELVFALAVAGPATRGAGLGGDDIHRRLVLIARWSVVAGIASGLAWFVIGAAVMNGTSVGQAMHWSVLELVLSDTKFGRVWVLRFALLAAFCVMLEVLRSSPSSPLRSRMIIGMLVIAAPYLGALAWTGHAAAGQGRDGDVEIGSDVVHLLASGAWLGALPGLVYMLRMQDLGLAAQATRRFSTLGAIAVTLVTASGLANSWYLVGDVPALIGTDYGRLLLAKLALFAAMLVLAMANRWHLSIRLPSEDREALRLLRRNAILEIAAGIGVVTIVGALGVTVPAAHQVPVWPFEHTLSWKPVADSAWRQVILAAAGAIALMSAGVAVAGFRPGLMRQWWSGLAGVAASVALLAWLLAVPAHPTTYAASAEPYTTESIVRGSDLYAANCLGCHGPQGRGDGPIGRSFPTRPAHLTELAARHRDGDIFWWIAHGIPGTPMPGFAPGVRDVDIWHLIQFLHAQADARDVPAIADGMQALPFVAAPEFTFEVTGHPQETLRRLPGNSAVLLVFYTLPQSLPRLRALARDEAALAKAGARIIAVPLHPSSSTAAAVVPARDTTIFATAGASVAAAYMMFARQPVGTADNAPRHVEFLIDRQGDLRFRWSGDALAQSPGTSETRNWIDLLNREPPRQQSSPGHAHR